MANKAKLCKFKKTHRSSRYRSEETHTVMCENEVVIIENDMGHRRGLMGKILPLIHSENKIPYLIEFGSAKIKKEMIKEISFDAPMLKLSELPQHKLSEFDGYQTASGGSSYDSNPKHSAKCFEYNFDKSKDYRAYHTKKSDFWQIADLDIENDSGVYVILDKFHVEVPAIDKSGYSSTRDPYCLKTLKETIEQAGIKFPKHIYAFKVAQRSKIENKDGWVELHTWAKQQLEAIIQSGNLNQAWIDIQKIDDLNEVRSERYYGSHVKEQIAKLKKLELADLKGTMGDFLSKHSQMSHGESTMKQIKGIQVIAKDFNVSFSSPKGVKPTFEIKRLYNAILEKYDMLPHLNRDVWNYGWDSKVKKSIENYVNVIDVCQKV